MLVTLSIIQITNPHMHSTLFIALLAGLGGMLGWGVADFLAKKTIDTIGDLRTLFWQQFFGVMPLLVLFLAHPHVPAPNRFDPLFLILLGITSAVLYLFLYAGFGKGQVSLLSPVMASYSVVVVLLSVILLGEHLSGLRILAILVTVAGILLISTDPQDLGRSFRNGAFKLAGLPDVIIAMLGYSFWLLYLDKFLNGKEWVFYLLAIRTVAAATLMVYAAARRIPLGFQGKGITKYLVGIGIFDVGAFGFVSYGFSHSRYPSVIAVLSATFSLPTMILAYIFLKEKIRPFQLAAALLIIGGIVLVTLS